MRILPISAHGCGHFAIRDGHDARGTFADNLQRAGIGQARGHAIGARIGGWCCHHTPRREGKRIGRRFGALHADNLGGKAQKITRQNAAANA